MSTIYKVTCLSTNEAREFDTKKEVKEWCDKLKWVFSPYIGDGGAELTFQFHKITIKELSENHFK